METVEKVENANQFKKEVYEKPSLEIIEVELEGVLCASGGGFDNGGGGRW